MHCWRTYRSRVLHLTQLKLLRRCIVVGKGSSDLFITKHSAATRAQVPSLAARSILRLLIDVAVYDMLLHLE